MFEQALSVNSRSIIARANFNSDKFSGVNMKHLHGDSPEIPMHLPKSDGAAPRERGHSNF